MTDLAALAADPGALLAVVIAALARAREHHADPVVIDVDRAFPS